MTSIGTTCLLVLGWQLLAADAPLHFESHILPIFKTRCLACHGSGVRQGGLSLETRDDVLRGGKTGAAVVPGRPAESLLLTLVNSGKMPMGGAKLGELEIDLLRRWIDAGALKQGEREVARLVSEREVFSTILGAKCFVCHGRRTQQAGLDLRTRESLLRGGKSGPAMVPGKPDESLIVKKIGAQQMPPPELQERYSVRGVTDDELAKLKKWIAAGAPPDNERPIEVRPDSDPLVSAQDRQHWAFRSPARPAVPSVRAANLVRNPLDAFLLAKLEEKGMTFSKPAGPLVLMRRAYIDLIGMPPAPEEIESYEADPSPNAYEKMIDRLLASPRHGERWAKHWLDAAGYADSEGAVSADTVRPHTWRYRDYVIRALNIDKPYDQFLTEQIAGDELFDYKATKQYTPEQTEKLVATGFLRMAPDSTYSTEQNFLADRYDTVAGEMQTLGTAVLGLSVACAQCHDHKYDPIPQRDYYRLSAILQTAYDPYDWRVPNRCLGVGAKCGDDDIRDIAYHSPEEERQNEIHNAPINKRIEELQKTLETKAAPLRLKVRAEKLEKLPAEVRKDFQQAADTPEDKRTELQKYLLEKFKTTLEVSNQELNRFDDYRELAREIQPKIGAERARLRPAPKIRALFDMGDEPTPNRILLRGDVNNPGALVEPGPPSVLSAALSPYKVEKPAYQSATSGRRLALARWLTQPNHPLTARVMANRIWQYHFGTGLVPSAANFGKAGLAPTHPELLDWLATEFVRQGWSMKSLHRLIMTSNAYRQSSRYDEARHAADPDNRLLSRFPFRRMDAEAVHDSLLKVTGRLDETAFGPPVEINQTGDGEVTGVPTEQGYRRAIYLLQRRSSPVTVLEVYDAPMLNPNCIKRGQSTVTLQALQLMNSDLAVKSAQYMAGRIIDAAGEDLARQVERVYLTALSRRPSAGEAAAAIRAIKDLREAWEHKLRTEKPAEPALYRAKWLAMAGFCHTVLNSAEFVYVD